MFFVVVVVCCYSKSSLFLRYASAFVLFMYITIHIYIHIYISLNPLLGDDVTLSISSLFFCSATSSPVFFLFFYHFSLSLRIGTNSELSVRFSFSFVCIKFFRSSVCCKRFTSLSLLSHSNVCSGLVCASTRLSLIKKHTSQNCANQETILLAFRGARRQSESKRTYEFIAFFPTITVHP